MSQVGMHCQPRSSGHWEEVLHAEIQKQDEES